jgi:hypothetical protein
MIFRYPFRCDSVPKFETQDTADAFLAEYQREGRILPCQYLAVVPSSVSTFSPWCAKDGFDNRRREHESLTVYEFHGCPLRCPFYTPHRRSGTRPASARRRANGGRSATAWVVVLVVLLLVLAAFGAAWWWRQDLLFNVSMVKELVAR